MKTFQIASTLTKSASAEWRVGGVASSFHRDLDGDAITPDAIADAIPSFMSGRGSGHIQGGPIRLHHDFWDGFLKRAIDSLRLPTDSQMQMVASIALPLGRVTKMWVDGDGKTHWEGILSAANPIAGIIWRMLKEGLVHLGVSVGGKILSAPTFGRDGMGRPANLITKIRLDELSITDNPALRLTNGEDTGAYITALAKSVGGAVKAQRDQKVTAFLRKAIGADTIGPGSGFASTNDTTTTTGMGRSMGEPKSSKPKGNAKVQLDAADTKTGMGGTSAGMNAPKGKGNEPKTDVWGMTVAEFTRDLGKCSDMGKAQLSSPEQLQKFSDGTQALAALTDAPPDALINFARFLQYFSRFASALPYMDDYQANGTVPAMVSDLHKAIEDFQEKMPTELMGRPLRPPGSPGVASVSVMFPDQYIVNRN